MSKRPRSGSTVSAAAAGRPPPGAADDALRALWSWLSEEQGAGANRLWVGDDAGGRGLRLTGAAAAGDVLLRLPAAALFTCRSVLGPSTSLGPWLRAAAAGGVRVGPLATLCCGLLHARGDAGSPWARFLASFPPMSPGMVCAAQFSAAELGRAPWASALHKEAGIQRRRILAVRSQLRALLRWSGSPDAPACPLGASTRDTLCSEEAVGWAWSVVSTRACFISANAAPLEHWARSAQNSGDEVEDDEDTSVLIPWLDLLNHSSNRPTASARWVPQAEVYEVQALCKMEAGEPVFLSYGALTNELLLARYGFVDPAHATDVAPLPAPVSGLLPPRGAAAGCARGGRLCLSDGCAACAARMALLQTLCLWPLEAAGDLTFCCPKAGASPPPAGAAADAARRERAASAVSWNLLTIVRVMTASDEEVGDGGRDSAVQRVAMDEPVSKASEAAAWGALEALARAQLEGMGDEACAGDEARDGVGAAAQHRAVLLDALRGKRREILRSALEALRALN